MLNKKKVAFFSLVAVAAFWLVWVLVRPANVVRVDGAAVYVQYLPLTTEGKISWWNDNKDKLQEKYHIIKDESHFTVAVMNFDGYVAAPTVSNDGSVDDYHCFAEGDAKNKCIYKDIAMIINGDANKRIFISLDGKTFAQEPDGKTTLLKK
ncbi:DUF943 family protein [Serratia ureilytica]|uniref:DUF943 family protein n=1 Tax=Serratia ureilytica TaxID=300181 RepID=UPI0018D996C9|nr:DUF943 family protein [Serratia ureilytica]MBH2757471.1 DUF943 family protein [Serratia ureilytica]